jgi:hypothetical protein
MQSVHFVEQCRDFLNFVNGHRNHLCTLAAAPGCEGSFDALRLGG